MRQSGIQRTILTSFTVILFVIVGLILFVAQQNLDHRLREDQAAKARIVVANLGTACADPLLIGELDHLKHIVGALKTSDPEVESALVLDKTGRCVASTDAGLFNKDLNSTDHEKKILAVEDIELFPLPAGRIEAAALIREGKESLGFLRITYSPVKIQKTIRSTLMVILAAAGLCFAAGAALYLFIIHKTVVRRIMAVANQLDRNAGVLTATSRLVSSNARSDAAHASQQAGSHQETSAALTEVTGMIQRNAENAQSAKDLANQTLASADAGASDMGEMNIAMAEVKAASHNIAKIIKTIDEIAFQTNILALNAAVEATRAGKAGMGFAVVANEVRALAQRSAKAAHETAERIKDSIAKSDNGVVISENVSRSLGEIVAKARTVDGLVAEIASASREQAGGIQQISRSVSEMEQATMENAANAEEGAAAAQELNGQAAALEKAVAELLILAGVRKTGRAAKPADVQRASARPQTASARPASNSHVPKPFPAAPKLAKPHGDRYSEIPMDGDFREF